MPLLRDDNFRFRDPAAVLYWPLKRQLAIVSAVLVFCMFGMYTLLSSGLYDQILAAAAKEESSLEELSLKTRSAAELQVVKSNVKQLEEDYQELMLQLPGDDDLSVILASIDGVGVQSNLKINRMSWNNAVIEQLYTTYPLSMSLEGNYDQLGSFAAGIAVLSRIVNLKDFTLTRINANGEQLAFEVDAAYYRFNADGGGSDGSDG